LDYLSQQDYCQDNTAEMVQVFGTVGVHPTRCAPILAVKTTSSSSSSSSNDEGVVAFNDDSRTVTTTITWTVKSDNQIQQIHNT
jgi:hypothetical protein